MVKTTLYLPDELKARIEQAARDERRAEADVIRDAIADSLDRRIPPAPVLGIFDSGDPDWASRASEDLDGFGET
jgi:hypothetical protein